MDSTDTSDKAHYSDEHLNSYIDDQLSTSEKAEILDAVRHDSELSQRVCKLQKIKNLIQLSYESMDVPTHYKNKQVIKKQGYLKWFAAASILFIVGSITGWVTHQSLNQDKQTELTHLTQYKALKNIAEPWKVMLHVSTDDPIRLNIILNEAESLLKEYEDTSRKLELEILTNNKGMTFVTDNGQSYSQRLQKLQSQHTNLILTACGETLKRISSTHKRLPLLPTTKVVSSALNEIVKRKKEGWTYIHI